MDLFHNGFSHPARADALQQMNLQDVNEQSNRITVTSSLQRQALKKYGRGSMTQLPL
jgi:hypothetical protein